MYGYGYRYNNGLVVGSGAPTPPPFANTYSLDFDGIDDHLGLTTTLDLGINCTISLWVKRDRTGTLEIYLGSSANSFAWLSYIATSNILYFKVGTTQYTFSNSPIATIMNDTTNWINICWQRSGNSLELFLNGVSMQTRTGIGTVINTTLDTIGTNASGGFGFLGNIDEVACWDTNTINPADIYNGGTPTDLSLLVTPPIAWYRNGDNGSWKSPQWLIPNNENFAANKVSNYSFEFDGVNDYVDCGVITTLQSATQYSLSCWVKTTDITKTQGILKWFYTTTAWIELSFITGILYAIPTSISGYGTKALTGIISNDVWYNIIMVFDGTLTGNLNRLKVYINGIEIVLGYTGTVSAITSNITTDGFMIGERYINADYFLGNIDEASIFNYALTSAEALAIGGTIPTDLSLLATPPTNYYKMGEESTFSGGVWTVPDQVGSNDGTSNAMTIEDRVGDAPNSENNALSFNMDFVDVVPDTP